MALAGSICAHIPDFSAVSTTWHSNDDDVYRAPPIDRSILPTAPRAAREPNIDRSRLPKSPPYTAFLGNLPYDVTEESIKDFFRGLNVSDIPEGGNAVGTQDVALSPSDCRPYLLPWGSFLGCGCLWVDPSFSRCGSGISTPPVGLRGLQWMLSLWNQVEVRLGRVGQDSWLAPW